MTEINDFIESGFKETAIGIVPIQWDVVSIQELGLRFFGGGTPSTSKPEYWGGNIPWATSAYIDDSLYLDDFAGYITQEGLEGSSTQFVPENNLLIGSRVGVGKVAINKFGVAISQDLTAMIVDLAKVNREFLAYSIRWDNTQAQILSSARGTTIKGIPRGDLLKVLIPLPPLLEQRRIAAVLNTILDDIATQDDIITEAKAFKRSLMQRLFTYGTGTEPAETNITAIGAIPAQWEQTPLGKLCEVEYGYQTSIPKTTPLNGTWIISTAEIKNEGYLDISKIRKVEIDEKRAKKYLIRKNDLLFNWRNSQEHVGKTALVSFEPIEPMIYASFILRIRPIKGVTYDYVHYLLSCLRDRGIFFKLSRRAVNQANFNANQLSELTIPVPELGEQQEIADLLHDTDQKIAAEEDRKVAMQDFFKTMLHQLMSGQIRLLSDKGLQFD